jgi:hypothetical protein
MKTAEWNEAHELNFQSLQDLFKTTRETLDYLKAAKERKVSPEELQRLIGVEKIRQDKIMTRLCDYIKRNGGRVTVGKLENGSMGRTAYNWTLILHVVGGHKLEFQFARCYEPEVYDVPLSHQWYFRPKGRRAFHVENDQGYNDCESVPELTQYVKRALKWASAEMGQKLELKK